LRNTHDLVGPSWVKRSPAKDVDKAFVAHHGNIGTGRLKAFSEPVINDAADFFVFPEPISCIASSAVIKLVI